MKTLIVVILDESGSMQTKKSDILGGFNGFIRDQKLIKNDEARLYLVKFGSIVNVVHNGIPLEEVPDLTTDNYRPGGMTALYDAIAKGVRIAAKDKTEDERVICVIMTDGEENSSRKTTKLHIKNTISRYEAKGDWTFLYIGENPEQWTRDTGMPANHGIQYNHRTPRVNSEITSRAIAKFRTSSDSKSYNLFD